MKRKGQGGNRLSSSSGICVNSPRSYINSILFDLKRWKNETVFEIPDRVSLVAIQRCKCPGAIEYAWNITFDELRQNVIFHAYFATRNSDYGIPRNVTSSSIVFGYFW